MCEIVFHIEVRWTILQNSQETFSSSHKLENRDLYMFQKFSRTKDSNDKMLNSNGNKGGVGSWIFLELRFTV